MMNRSTTRIRLLVAVLVSILSFSLQKRKPAIVTCQIPKDGIWAWMADCLSAYPLFPVSDTTRPTWAGLPASMAAIVSTPFSQQNSLPDMER